MRDDKSAIGEPVQSLYIAFKTRRREKSSSRGLEF